MKKQYATTDQVGRARDLRVNGTEVEKRLWNRLRARQLDGYKFRRQHFAEGFFLDFACEEKKLAVELDGGQHAEHQEKDRKRTVILEQSGWRIMRFWNHDVIENIEGVLETIRDALTQNHEG